MGYCLYECLVLFLMNEERIYFKFFIILVGNIKKLFCEMILGKDIVLFKYWIYKFSVLN